MSWTEVINKYRNGNIKEKYFIDENNRKNGSYQSWYENGKDEMKGEYKDGVLNGLCELWYENGRNGAPTGPLNKNKAKLEYKDGVLNGLYQWWYENGQNNMKVEYKDGVRNGPYQSWYENGSSKVKCEYKDGELYGLYQSWCENGNKKVEYEYRDGEIIKINEINDINGRNCILQDGIILEVWKACKFNDISVYVKLSVPLDAKRITPLNDQYKSRVEFAQVEQIIDREGKEYTEAVSFVHPMQLVYRVGELVYPDGFDDNIAHDCGKGINVHKYKDHCDVWFK